MSYRIQNIRMRLNDSVSNSEMLNFSMPDQNTSLVHTNLSRGTTYWLGESTNIFGRDLALIRVNVMLCHSNIVFFVMILIAISGSGIANGSMVLQIRTEGIGDSYALLVLYNYLLNVHTVSLSQLIILSIIVFF